MSHNSADQARSLSRHNFALPWFLTLITAIEALLLSLAAVQIYGFPLWQGLRWPWALLPYNAVFLGGLYWAAFAAVLFQIVVRRWAPARLVQPMVLVFSAVILSVSLAYFGLFDWQRRLVKAWFIIYGVVPASAAIAVVTYRDRRPANIVQLPSRYPAILRLKALCLGLYGLALLIAPESATAFWPWLIDAFHARLYSAIFLAAAVGNGLLSHAAARAELGLLGIVELLLGALPLLGILRIDRIVGRIDWSQGGSLVWLALLGIWAIAGADLMRQSRR